MTASVDTSFFDLAFRNLTGWDSFPWQRELYQRMIEGTLPSTCEIPTGLGKTAAVAVWLIALAKHPEITPRRLVYVVNRRTVVDQTTAEVERLRGNLRKANLWEPLIQLCAIPLKEDEPPLAVSTLRGQYADNREWSADPARPAVIVGTVDLIGSRLLFSGYRIGFRTRPLHAGFLGQDALVIHDEAHLEPAFQKLLTAILDEQKRSHDFRPFSVMALTATPREAEPDREAPRCGLTAEEKNPPVNIPEPPTAPIHHVWRRLKARKAIHLVPIDDEKSQLAAKMVELALSDKFTTSGQRILVYAHTVEVVETIAETLARKGRRVQRLTGTLRGLERDQLVKDPVFRRFLPGAGTSDETVYLVCTSAGEVGANITGDHLIADLTTFESMVQRFGRVNRFGEHAASEICVVHPVNFDTDCGYDVARRRTLDLLRQLSGDASSAALSRLSLPACAAAFAPAPTILPVSEFLFGIWSLTTIRDELPGRPPVEHYLHGIAEWEPPETEVAWREEVGIITGGLLEQYDPEELLEDYPLRPHELVRDRSDRVFTRLQSLARRHPDAPAWIVDCRGNVIPTALGRVATPAASKASEKRSLIEMIAGRTLLLSPSVGGLSRGSLDPDSDNADDVSAIDAPDSERRLRLWSDDPAYDVKTAGMRLVRSIAINREIDEDEQPTWNWYKYKPLEDLRTSDFPVALAVHVNDVVRLAQEIAAKLCLPEELATVLRVACRLHDEGKRREQFQSALGNHQYPAVVLAKSGRSGAKLPEIYRHEFASLADATQDGEFRALPPHMQDLVLHLIAAHHGRARPHFPLEEAFDPAEATSPGDANRLATEVPRRFARLQRTYGRWGLAYLESLLRAVDWAASAEPSQFLSNASELM